MSVERQWTDDELLAADAAARGALYPDDDDDRSDEQRIQCARDVLNGAWEHVTARLAAKDIDTNARDVYATAVRDHLFPPKPLHERLAWQLESQDRTDWWTAMLGKIRLSLFRRGTGWGGHVTEQASEILGPVECDGPANSAKAALLAAYFSWLDARNEERRALVEGR